MTILKDSECSDALLKQIAHFFHINSPKLTRSPYSATRFSTFEHTLGMQENSPPLITSALTLLVGLSGGLDSVVLLDLMVRLKQNLGQAKQMMQTCLVNDENQSFPKLNFTIKSIRAIYVHHGLSKNADDWARHCQMLCDEYGIPLVIQRVHVDTKLNGIEAGARKARYEAFKQHLLPSDVLLTAQHQDDQAETFMLALKRGSGPLGLGGMLPIRQLDSLHWHARPLLEFSRCELEHYAHTYSLKWINDESNDNDAFDRNFLRLNVMPILQERWPYFQQAVARSAELCQSQERLLDELLAPVLDSIIEKREQSLDIEALRTFTDEKRYAVIRRWCQLVKLHSPTNDQIRRIWSEVALSRQDSHAMVEMGYSPDQNVMLQVKRYHNRLYKVLLPVNTSNHDNLYILELNQSEIPIPQLTTTVTRERIIKDLLRLAESLQLTQDEIVRYKTYFEQQPITIRFGLPSSFQVSIIGQDRGKTIKKIWQIFNIPPWKRHFIPYFFIKDKLLMGGELFLAKLD
ncbi:tRNA lysidine(34) synthetase TilS [Thorsellia anophelis]|uniref:tRNA(Ile)-lysidine synthase n=1 Tax=Thorsellia anophelis DSM 18579 TaxID=1123402 RepID=A0A1I0AGD5_9GAMM|nr:tRNA lysidine(34) synthetase TilS [Thorsellia anophelis]SES93342.1 tRNA(Ile)-lysidine synthase [Thorsellia anophelis DSM 18579]